MKAPSLHPIPAPHQSDSGVQLSAESVALAELNRAHNLNLAPAVVALPNGTRVQLDGVNEAAKVACEIYAHVGKLKGAQPDKLASDILKLLLLERHKGGTWRKLICFVDEAAARSLQNKSWLASTCGLFGVEVVVVPLPEETRQLLLQAQSRQRMVNPAQ